MKHFLLFATTIVVFNSCTAQPVANPPATNTAARQPAATAQGAPAQKTPEQIAAENAAFQKDFENAKGVLMPSIDNEKMQFLFANVASIDYIFYNQDFSVSADASNAKSNLMYISTKNAKKLEGQKAVGRIYYAANGDIALDAEVFFGATQVEQYLVFMDKQGKPYAANYLTPQGVAFFKQVVNARMEAHPKN